MPLMTTGKCFRNRTDCESFSVIEATPEALTEEQFQTLDYDPATFVCCGCIKPGHRNLPRDAYRLCFKSAGGADELSDNDEQDLAHTVAVITQALAVIASRRIHRSHIDVPDDLNSGELISVSTTEGTEDANV